MLNLLHFPTTAIVNRNIPKNAFYKHWAMGTRQRQHFVDDIASLTWLYKLGEGTINVAVGQRIEEIDFFAATLKHKACPDDVFTLIDTHMPQYLVFLLCYADECRLLLNYKDKNVHNKAQPFHIVKTFKSDWASASNLRLTIDGNTLDDVWENFAGAISGYNTSTAQSTRAIIDLQQLIDLKTKTRQALLKKIDRERQFNRQVELSTRARQLKQEIASLQQQIKAIKREIMLNYSQKKLIFAYYNLTLLRQHSHDTYEIQPFTFILTRRHTTQP